MKLGLIGAGQWGRNYLRVLRELRHEVVSVSDRDPNRLAESALSYPGVETTLDAGEVIGHPAIDAVVIATPASTHFGLAEQALHRDKHVLVEKPMTLHREQAERLIDLAARRARVLMVGHTFLYNDAVRLLRDLVRAPESGHVYYMTSRRTHLGLIRQDVSALWDLAPHDVSLACHLSGSTPSWVSAVAAHPLATGQGDAHFVTLGFPDGVVAQIQVSWVDAHKVREFVVVTSRRRLVFNDLDAMEPVRVFEKGVTIERDVSNFGEFRALLRDGDTVSPRVDQREPLRNLCEHFVTCAMTGLQPRTDGRAGLQVIRVLEAATLSAARSGSPIEVA